MAYSYFSPTAATPLNDIHRRDQNNNKFLIVEDELNGLPWRWRAFFHNQNPNSILKYEHWSLPMAYENNNKWEALQIHPTVHLPSVKLPENVQYLSWFPNVDNIPVIKLVKEPNEEIEPGITLTTLIRDNINWLKKYLGVEINKALYTGQTGIYFFARVVPLAKPVSASSFYGRDVHRLISVRSKKVVIKWYITCGMIETIQMDRLYEETLAHCELKHPNIVDTYSVRYRARKVNPNDEGEINAIDGNTDLHSLIIMEYSEVGSLFMLFSELQDNNLGFAYFHCYLQDIISGLLYLHSTGRAHRELNDTNFLAVQSTRGLNFRQNLQNVKPTLINCTIKICDFAYTKKFDRPAEQELMHNWQSMDAMDLGRNVLFICFDSIKKFIDEQTKKNVDDTESNELTKELLEIVRFLCAENILQRLLNLHDLEMKENDVGRNVRQFMNKVVADARQSWASFGEIMEE